MLWPPRRPDKLQFISSGVTTKNCLFKRNASPKFYKNKNNYAAINTATKNMLSI